MIEILERLCLPMIDRKTILDRLGFIVLAHNKLAAADVADAFDFMRSMMVASATSMETT